MMNIWKITLCVSLLGRGFVAHAQQNGSRPVDLSNMMKYDPEAVKKEDAKHTDGAIQVKGNFHCEGAGGQKFEPGDAGFDNCMANSAQKAQQEQQKKTK